VAGEIVANLERTVRAIAERARDAYRVVEEALVIVSQSMRVHTALPTLGPSHRTFLPLSLLSTVRTTRSANWRWSRGPRNGRSKCGQATPH
jgi:hypothetical protein